MRGYYLKCDAKGCDHVEPRPGLLEADIGMPCPKCGANLLTREDYEFAKPLWAVLDILNGFDDQPSVDVAAELPEHMVRTSVNVHRGKTIIEIERGAEE